MHTWKSRFLVLQGTGKKIRNLQEKFIKMKRACKKLLKIVGKRNIYI